LYCSIKVYRIKQRCYNLFCISLGLNYILQLIKFINH
jgi:hypothetical protein